MRTPPNAPDSHERKNPRRDIEHSRRELINFLTDSTSADAEDADGGLDRDERTSAERENRRAGHPTQDGASSIDWFAMLQTGLSTWWRDHPLRAGSMLLTPSIEEYARRKPMHSVAIAAAAGAALVILRPWRLVSASAIALSLYRSSNLSGMATSLLATATQSLQKENFK